MKKRKMLSEREVQVIRALDEAVGGASTVLGEVFNVSPQTILNIRHRVSHQDVKDLPSREQTVLVENLLTHLRSRRHGLRRVGVERTVVEQAIRPLLSA